MDKCPKCQNELKFYDGVLGYEAMICDKCGYYVDNNEEGFWEGYIKLKKGYNGKYQKNC